MPDWIADPDRAASPARTDPDHRLWVGIGLGMAFLAAGAFIVYGISDEVVRILVNNLLFPVVALAVTLL